MARAAPRTLAGAPARAVWCTPDETLRRLARAASPEGHCCDPRDDGGPGGVRGPGAHPELARERAAGGRPGGGILRRGPTPVRQRRRWCRRDGRQRRLHARGADEGRARHGGPRQAPWRAERAQHHQREGRRRRRGHPAPAPAEDPAVGGGRRGAARQAHGGAAVPRADPGERPRRRDQHLLRAALRRPVRGARPRREDPRDPRCGRGAGALLLHRRRPHKAGGRPAHPPRPYILHADRTRRGDPEPLALLSHQARGHPAACRRGDRTRLDDRRARPERARDRARHIRAAGTGARGGQLVRHPRDGALLRAVRGGHRAHPGRRARLRTGVAAARDLRARHGDRLRGPHGEPHPRHLGAGCVRGRRRPLPRHRLSHVPAGRPMPFERVARRARDGSPALSGLLGRIARLVACTPGPIWWITAALAGIAFLGIRRIDVDADFLNYFSPHSEVRQANEIINREIGGSNLFYVVVEGPEPGALRRWVNLWLMKDLQRYLGTLPGITSSISIVDYMELLESGLAAGSGGDLVVNEHGDVVPVQKPRTFWEDPAQLAPVLDLVGKSPETFAGVITPDFGKASILVRTPRSGSRAVEQTLARIREYVANRFPAELRVHLTGNLVLLTGTASDIVAGQVKSLALALGVIFVVLSLMFLSVRI